MQLWDCSRSNYAQILTRDVEKKKHSNITPPDRKASNSGCTLCSTAWFAVGAPSFLELLKLVHNQIDNITCSQLIQNTKVKKGFSATLRVEHTYYTNQDFPWLYTYTYAARTSNWDPTSSSVQVFVDLLRQRECKS